MSRDVFREPGPGFGSSAGHQLLAAVVSVCPSGVRAVSSQRIQDVIYRARRLDACSRAMNDHRSRPFE